MCSNTKHLFMGNIGTESPFTCKVEQFCLYNNATTRRKNFILDVSFGIFFLLLFLSPVRSLLFLHVAKINITKKFIFVGIPEEQQKSLKIHVVVDFCVNVFSLISQSYSKKRGEGKTSKFFVYFQ